MNTFHKCIVLIIKLTLKKPEKELHSLSEMRSCVTILSFFLITQGDDHTAINNGSDTTSNEMELNNENKSFLQVIESTSQYQFVLKLIMCLRRYRSMNDTLLTIEASTATTVTARASVRGRSSWRWRAA